MDCFEVVKNKPSDRCAAAADYSRYYDASTWKFNMLGHSGGFPIYVSDPYPGGTTDNEIIVAEWSNITRFVPRGSVIYNDKGLIIDAEIVSRQTDAGIVFFVPARKGKGAKQQEIHHSEQSHVKSNVRIVAENLIGRASILFPFIRGRHAESMADIMGPAVRSAFLLTAYMSPLTSGSTPSAKKVKAIAKSAATAAAAAAECAAAAAVESYTERPFDIEEDIDFDWVPLLSGAEDAEE